MKDIPAVNPSDLEICCYMPRIESSDVFISNSGKTLKEIESGSTIGTSSIRRRAQLLNCRRDLNIKLLRGNVDTRLKKLKNKEFDAIILAHAGLKRLNLENEILKYSIINIFCHQEDKGVLVYNHFQKVVIEICLKI